jgi:hypothetical protein
MFVMKKEWVYCEVGSKVYVLLIRMWCLEDADDSVTESADLQRAADGVLALTVCKRTAVL